MEQKNNFYILLTGYLAMILTTIIFLMFTYGCFNTVNKHKPFINILLEYYPDKNIKIIESDPNMLIIQIIKKDKLYE